MDRPTKPIRLEAGEIESDYHDAPVTIAEQPRSQRASGKGRGSARRSLIEERLSRIGERLGRSTVRVSLSAMNVSDGKRTWLPPLVYLAYNYITIGGLFLVNATGVFWLFVLPVATRDAARHPYLLIVFFGILPISFLLGLVAIPLGMYRRYKQMTRKGVEARAFEPLGWDNREFRQLSLFLAGATFCNVLIGGYVSQHTVHYMDSPGFCSTTCHSMNPQYIAFQDSPHKNIECVECHIGSGRRAYARAKLNGLWQVAANVFELYPTPIPTPLENLRPAREICESCHWPRSYTSVQIRVLDHFAEDSANTHTKTVLALRIGGGGANPGIHGAHVTGGERIDYVAANGKQDILWLSRTDSAGRVTEYRTTEWDHTMLGEHEVRSMDCLDCHTRPSHRFYTAERALDEALAKGRITTELPWIRKYALEALSARYSSAAEAALRIPESLEANYMSKHSELHSSSGELIAQAAAGVVSTYQRNVFPSMGIDWGTYPDHSGHSDFPGCFRCHGSGLSTADGESISADCSMCHIILAMGETEPPILRQLGIGH